MPKDTLCQSIRQKRSAVIYMVDSDVDLNTDPPKKLVANILGLARDLKTFFFSTFKRWVDINLVILLTWIRIRVHKILCIRIRI